MNKTDIILSFLVLILLIVLVYVNVGDESKNKETILNNYLNTYYTRCANMDNYRLIYDENISNHTKQLIVERMGDEYVIDLKDTYFDWILQRKNGKELLCLKLGLYTACVKPTTSQTSLKVAQMLKMSLIDDNYAQREANWYTILQKANALHLYKIDNKENCVAFYFNYSYRDLSFSQLEQLGYSPGSPIVNVKNYNNMVCLSKDGYMLEKESRYEFNNKPVLEAFKLVKIENINSLNFVNGNEDEAYFITLTKRLKTLLTDLNNATDQDLRSMAVDLKIPKLCELTTDPVTCIDAFITITHDARACDILNTRRDECYLKAGKEIDKYFCNFISDQNLKQECENYKG